MVIPQSRPAGCALGATRDRRAARDAVLVADLDGDGTLDVQHDKWREAPPT
jgi:hypothetical protein